MQGFKAFVLAAVAGICFTAVPSTSQAQISVNIGPAPVCPYGYFDTPPYGCAPYGYYGPEWFQGGIFIGAGPWFHGHDGFYGHVDNHFHPDHGYRGSYPHRGDRPRGDWHGGPAHFHGNEMRDGRGHVGGRRH